jgi:hypothetical protein
MAGQQVVWPLPALVGLLPSLMPTVLGYLIAH